MSHSVAPMLRRVNPAGLMNRARETVCVPHLGNARETWSGSRCFCGRRSLNPARGALLCVVQNKGIAVDLATAAVLTRGWNHPRHVASPRPRNSASSAAAGGTS